MNRTYEIAPRVRAGRNRDWPEALLGAVDPACAGGLPGVGGSETGAWTGEDLRGETACLRMEKVTITAPCPIQAGPQPHDSLAEAYAQFMLDRRARNVRPATLRFYEQQLLPFLAWCSDTGAEGIEGVLPAHVRGYIAQRREQGLADASLVSAYRALHAFFSFCAAEELIDRSPMDKVTKPRCEQRIPQALDCAGVTRLLQACDHVRDQALVLVLVDTGCRASELLGMEGRDVDLDRMLVHIRHTKARKDRLQPFSVATRDALRRYYAWRGEPAPDERVWVTVTAGQALQYDGLKQLMRRLGPQSGIGRISAHTLRRTFATLAHRNGIGIEELARLMGHSSTQVLARYVAVTEADTWQAHREFGPLTGDWLSMPEE